ATPRNPGPSARGSHHPGGRERRTKAWSCTTMDRGSRPHHTREHGGTGAEKEGPGLEPLEAATDGRPDAVVRARHAAPPLSAGNGRTAQGDHRRSAERRRVRDAVDREG